MARESIIIPVSREPLYEAVAVFLAVLAYPDHPDSRDRFCATWCREHLRASAKEDADFASAPQLIRPGFFLMTEAMVEDVMREGAGKLDEREEAYILTHTLFDAADTGQKITNIDAFGTRVKNNAGGRAILTKYWKDVNWDKDSKSAAKNYTTRVINPSRPVIHAAAAYWRIVLELRREGYVSDDRAAQRMILHEREAFEGVLSLAEVYRGLAPSIPDLRVGEDDLIEFRAV